MSSPRTTRHVGVVVLLALGLSGCGAGMNAVTYRERNLGNATNVSLGELSVLNVQLLPPSSGRTYEAGTDVRGTFRVINSGVRPDQLVEVTSPQAAQVVLLSDGAPSDLAVPADGSTGESGAFILRGLTGPLGTGEFVTMTFRFAEGGAVDVLVPVATTGRSNRPARTGEPGSAEGEPALQGPAGGHGQIVDREGSAPESDRGIDPSGRGGTEPKPAN